MLLTSFIILLTALSGFVVLANKLCWAKNGLTKSGWTEYFSTLFPIMLVILLLRSFVIEPFRVPSESMVPTLMPGDIIVVNRYTYGLRMPITGQAITSSAAPARGDIVVFHAPRNPILSDYVKRIVGMPGDKVTYKDKILSVNGYIVQQKSNGRYEYASDNGVMKNLTRFDSNLMGVLHPTLINELKPSETVDAIVPPGHYFVMGDNRDNSMDSRYWGFVPEKYIVGRVSTIIVNLTSGGRSMSPVK